MQTEGICDQYRSQAVAGKLHLGLESPSLQKMLHRFQGLVPNLCNDSCIQVCVLYFVLKSAQIKFKFISEADIISMLVSTITFGSDSSIRLSYHQ